MRNLFRFRSMIVLLLIALLSPALLPLRTNRVLAETKTKRSVDWSVAIVESTMKRFPTAKDFGNWGYVRALYLYGQYLVYKRTRDPRYFAYIKNWVDQFVDENGIVRSPNSQGVLSEVKFDNLDSMFPGNLLLVLYQETREQKYKLAADKIRKRFDAYPRTSDGGFWHGAGKNREMQLWGDGVHMSMLFLVRYGNMFGDNKYANDEAIKQLTVYASHLNDPKTGLMFHAYDESGQTAWSAREGKHSPEIWCRAMGWFGITLIEVLGLLPRNHPERPKLLAQLEQLVKAWTNYQNKQTGLWYQVVDKGSDPANWLETSSSSMYTFAIAMAVQNGYVNKKYLVTAEKGYDGVLSKISLDADGMSNLTDVCEGTNVADLAYYYARKRVTNDFHGLGAFLIMNEKFMNRSTKGSSRSFWQPSNATAK